MAIFSIENVAGRGGWIPYANSTINDMLASPGVYQRYSDNGYTAVYDMANTSVDVVLDYTNRGGGNITANDVMFGVGATYIGGIEGLNLALNQNAGQYFNNTIVNGGNDLFYGNDFADLIHGGNGTDVIWGAGDNDQLYGDYGDDFLEGEGGNDFIDGGAGVDWAFFTGNSWEYTASRQANGDVIITDLLGRNGTDYLTGVEGFSFGNAEFTLDQFAPIVVAPPPVVAPPSVVAPPPVVALPPVVAPPPPTPPVNIYGTGGADTLVGNDLDNSLFGGAGRDMLWGGAGKDAFVFDTSPKSGRDFIKDFNVRDDSIHLDNADFTKVGGSGHLKNGAFWTNTTGKAHDASDRIIYDKDSGVLYYDADGTGKGASVAFATISKNLALTNKDFLII